MTRRLGRFVLSLALGAWTAGALGRSRPLAVPGALASAPPPPNIVVLMADDLDLPSFQAARRAGFLPHLRRLFRHATRFRQSFVSESLCGPSRATYLTGLYPHNHGVARNKGTHGGLDAFTPAFGDNNLAVWLQAAGYRTAHVGKYLNGYLDGTIVPHGWDEWHATVDPSTYCMYDYDLSDNGQVVHYGRHPLMDYKTDVLARVAESLILDGRAHGDTRPLFVNLAPTTPHREVRCFDGIRPAPRHRLTRRLDLPRPPSFNEADMSDKPGWMQGLAPLDEAALATLYNQRIAAMRAVDDMLGRVVAALDAIGELERTAFVFTSDNGYLLGRHRWEAKRLLYEEAIRVPLLVKLPDRSGPRTVDEVVLNNDLAPTLVDIARAAPGLAMDGRSLLALLEQGSAAGRKRFLVSLPPVTPGAESDDELDPDPAVSIAFVPPFVAVRTGDDGDLTRLVYAEMMTAVGEVVTARELYDLRPAVDPFQIASRHDDPAYLVRRQRLKEHLDALRTCRNGTCQTLEE